MKHLEDKEQIALFKWASLARMPSGYFISEYLFAIPNGGKRNILEASRLKKQGVKKGISDMFLPIPSKGFHGLWIELKAKEGKATKEQVEWLDKMATQGYAAIICYGWQDASKAIQQYLGVNDGNN
jgi:hypothetical protein